MIEKTNGYIIKSRGRTGSHIIAEYFGRHRFHLEFIDHEGNFMSKNPLLNSKNLMIHSHDIYFVPQNPECYTLIHSTRQNKFNQYCSFLIARKTKNYSGMLPEIEFEKIKINEKQTKKEIESYVAWDDEVKNHTKKYTWKNVYEISYETIKDNSCQLFQLIPLQEQYNEDKQKYWGKSPYIFENHIENYEYWNYKFAGNKL